MFHFKNSPVATQIKYLLHPCLHLPRIYICTYISCTLYPHTYICTYIPRINIHTYIPRINISTYIPHIYIRTFIPRIYICTYIPFISYLRYSPFSSFNFWYLIVSFWERIPLFTCLTGLALRK